MLSEIEARKSELKKICRMLNEDVNKQENARKLPSMKKMVLWILKHAYHLQGSNLAVRKRQAIISECFSHKKRRILLK